jgi:hypothetical protein
MAQKNRKERRPVECIPDPIDPDKFWTCLDGENVIPIMVRGLSTPEELDWFATKMAEFLWKNRHLAKTYSPSLKTKQE